MVRDRVHFIAISLREICLLNFRSGCSAFLTSLADKQKRGKGKPAMCRSSILRYLRESTNKQVNNRTMERLSEKETLGQSTPSLLAIILSIPVDHHLEKR